MNVCTFFAICICLTWLTYLYQKPQVKSFSPSNHLSLAEAKQSRNYVRKDLWIVQTPTERVCNRIESDTSTLIFQPKDHAIQVFEQLSHIRCWIQEKNSSGEKQTCFILASEGTYRYQNQNFEANDVFLSIHKLAQTPFSFDLTNHAPFLQGKAAKVTFSLQNGSQSFQASQFKASLRSLPRGQSL
jgi:hypothetical protein